MERVLSSKISMYSSYLLETYRLNFYLCLHAPDKWGLEKSHEKEVHIGSMEMSQVFLKLGNSHIWDGLMEMKKDFFLLRTAQKSGYRRIVDME